jgi:hypothetical protein
MSDKEKSAARPLKREVLWFIGMLAFGILVLPVLVFFVGQVVFGAYEGDGYGGFFSALLEQLLAFDGYAWFLVLSPFICISILRLLGKSWKMAGSG